MAVPTPHAGRPGAPALTVRHARAGVPERALVALDCIRTMQAE